MVNVRSSAESSHAVLNVTRQVLSCAVGYRGNKGCREGQRKNTRTNKEGCELRRTSQDKEKSKKKD